MAQCELELEKLRQRLHKNVEIEDEAKEQMQRLKEELTLRNNETSHLRSTVDNLERSCERLREEVKSRPMPDAVSDLEAQVEKVRIRVHQFCDLHVA